MSDDFHTLDATVTQLRQTEPTFADSHFTASVMAQVSQSHELPTWASNSILLGATALGSAILAWQTPLVDPTNLIEAVTTNLPAVLVAAAASTYGSALAAMWAMDR
jgi:hypothetical protein